MKQIFILILLSFCFQISIAQNPQKVLFIGNSYTGTHNLPMLISGIALSKNDSMIYDECVYGGYTLKKHSTNQTTISKIKSKKWDYVILQEQSQLPSFPPSQVKAEVFPFADTLVKMIKHNDSCTKVLFFMTWGRKNGDQQNCQYYPPICTYEGMQARLRLSYLEMANMFNASVAPVGMAWKLTRVTNPSIDLYSPDESHPSMFGSYLAALTIYASIFESSPIGAAYPSSLIPKNHAEAIQKNVHQIVFDSLSIWKIDTNIVKAKFSIDSIGDNKYQFKNLSEFAEHYLWDFGDGTTSSEKEPVHSYTYSDTFKIKLIARKKCNIDSMIFKKSICYHNNIQTKISNPIVKVFGFERIEINTNEIFHYQIFDHNGRIVSQGFNQKDVGITHFHEGIYILKINTQNGSFSKKIVKAY